MTLPITKPEPSPIPSEMNWRSEPSETLRETLNLLPWRAVARPNQLPPKGYWFVWLILAGRGWGKTRTGAEYIASYLSAQPAQRAALVAQTFDDGRDVMVEGESGLEAVLTHRKVSYRWNRSLGQLILANGSRVDIYSSERPKQLRGPQHHVAWGDEPAHWDDAKDGDAEGTTWSNLKLGLRLGSDPRCVLTTTPQRNKLIRLLVREQNVKITGGSTYENLDNLSDRFRREVVARYEGTRLGRQELHAELLEDVPGAPVKAEMIVHLPPPSTVEQGRLVPHWLAGCVAVDPAVSTGEDSDETGIIAVGKAVDGHGYVIEDYSGRYTPQGWASKAIFAAGAQGFDTIVGEVNNGGDMVEATLRSAGWKGRFVKVHASRGKLTRAEPVIGAYERSMSTTAPGWHVYHVREFPELEDQWTTYLPETSESPDRLDAEVWGFWHLFPPTPTTEFGSLIA